MPSREQLQSELELLAPHVYFQAPSGFNMQYPCIMYRKTNKSRDFANDSIYNSRQEYSVTVIDRNPDSKIADNVEKGFMNCTIVDYATVDNLNHTYLSLFY